MKTLLFLLFCQQYQCRWMYQACQVYPISCLMNLYLLTRVWNENPSDKTHLP